MPVFQALFVIVFILEEEVLWVRGVQTEAFTDKSFVQIKSSLRCIGTKIGKQIQGFRYVQDRCHFIQRNALGELKAAPKPMFQIMFFTLLYGFPQNEMGSSSAHATGQFTELVYMHTQPNRS